jgi:hypothetical protein
MAHASTSLYITLVPSRAIAQGVPVIVNGFNRSVMPLLSGITIAPSSITLNEFVWYEDQQALSFTFSGGLVPNDRIIINLRVTNGVFKSTARLSISVEATDTFLTPTLHICRQAAVTYASISETSPIQGQSNRISVILEFNFEIVKGTTITLSGFLDTMTPDNDMLKLDDGIDHLLGYSGIWKQDIGQLVVTATESLNLRPEQLVISFTVKNALNPRLTPQTIVMELESSGNIGACGGRFCDLTPEGSSASRCEQSLDSNPFTYFKIPTRPDFLTYKESPRFVTFQVCMPNKCTHSHLHNLPAEMPGSLL